MDESHQVEEKLLKDYTVEEKGAYISAIASIATADRTASEDELNFLEALSDAAALSPEQKEKVRTAAESPHAGELRQQLDILKGSELRFSLITDLISFAESDENYSSEERAMVEQMATHLNINAEQFQTINRFVQEAKQQEVDLSQPQHFSGSGIEQQLGKAGINMGSLTKGLLATVGPMILASLMSRGAGSRSGGLGGMLGGLLGGNSAGNAGGGMLGGGGGLGSIIGMLNGGGGMRSTGGLLGKIFGR